MTLNNKLIKIIKEDEGASSATTTVDIAIAPSRIPIEPDGYVNETPYFTVDSEDEFHSFSLGIKKFKRWAQHTKSTNVREWANQNRGKDFFIKSGSNHALIRRSIKHSGLRKAHNG